MDQYQFVFIMQGKSSNSSEKVEEFIAKAKGKIEKKESWGKKNFAYLINKQASGHYFDWILSISANKIAELKNLLNLDGTVVRYLLLKQK